MIYIFEPIIIEMRNQGISINTQPRIFFILNTDSYEVIFLFHHR